MVLLHFTRRTNTMEKKEEVVYTTPMLVQDTKNPNELVVKVNVKKENPNG